MQLVGLEWEKLVSLAAEEARTAPGKTLVLSLQDSSAWASTKDAARERQAETLEATTLLMKSSLWGVLEGLEEISHILEAVSKGGVLDLAGLVQVRQWLVAIETWFLFPKDDLSGKHFKQSLSRLFDPSTILTPLERSLAPDGSLSENASTLYASLLRESRRLDHAIRSKMDELLKDYAQKNFLQDKFFDVRGGQYLLPIKVSEQGKVEGTVVEFSVSRQTLFVEPREIQQLQSQRYAIEAKKSEEVFRILKEQSDRLRPFVGDITVACTVLAHWDSVCARARLGSQYGGKTILVQDDLTLALKNSAHPVLWWTLDPENIIRNDLALDPEHRALLITGPNTGGKTVLLKTLGLAGICARTGFLFPGTEPAKVPFFESFFVDLGDDQSIETHLSSFSSHVMKLKVALEHLTDRSLILVDELNTATDPEEGAALARAFLETVLGEKNVMVVATTHDPNLKLLSKVDPRIEVGAMEFNEGSLTPTFRLRIGVPGQSRAIETAQRLGFPPKVIDLARSYMSKAHGEMERMIQGMQKALDDAQRTRSDANRLRDEAERMHREWTEKSQKTMGEVVEQVRKKLKQIVTQTEDEARATLKKLSGVQLRSGKTESQEILHKAETDVFGVLKEEAPEVAKLLLEKEKTTFEKQTVDLRVGDWVRVPKWRSVGRIQEIMGNKFKVAPSVSNQKNMLMLLTLTRAELEVLSEAEMDKLGLQRREEAEKGGTLEIQDGSKAEYVQETIDLRGKRFDEAMTELEHYLDQAFRGERKEVTIVHGLGTGAIREGARKLLAKLPYIETFVDGGPGRGGAGATVVTFK